MQGKSLVSRAVSSLPSSLSFFVGIDIGKEDGLTLKIVQVGYDG